VTVFLPLRRALRLRKTPTKNLEGRPLDPFLAFVEGSELSNWIRGDSMLAFPAIITLHTIGMGFLAGGSAAIDLRILGAAPKIPLAAMARFYPLLWMAIAVNITTGILLLIGYPTKRSPTRYSMSSSA